MVTKGMRNSDRPAFVRSLPPEEQAPVYSALRSLACSVPGTRHSVDGHRVTVSAAFDNVPRARAVLRPLGQSPSPQNQWRYDMGEMELERFHRRRVREPLCWLALALAGVLLLMMMRM